MVSGLWESSFSVFLFSIFSLKVWFLKFKYFKIWTIFILNLF
jgi:hypothetical protein